MLLLERKQHQSITINVVNENIVVKVIDIAMGRVRLGIDAPREFTILRTELLDKPECPRCKHSGNH